MNTEPVKYKFKSAEEQKLYDINAKLDMAKLVIKICLAKKYNVNSIQDLLVKRASQYFSNEIITQLLAKVNKKTLTPKTFKDWIEVIQMGNMDGTDDCHSDKLLRDIMLNFYLVKKTLPTKEAIWRIFSNVNESWDNSRFEIYMKTRGYKSKRLPRCSKSIIVEDPENSIARIKYLQSIAQFRITGVPIIYIEERIVTKKGCYSESLKQRYEDATMFYMAVSSSLGMISKKMIKILANAKPDNRYLLLTNWIAETVVPHLSPPSVFVLEDNIHKSLGHVEMPMIDASKKEMITWLEQNDIPHNPNMHSAELFELIKRSNFNLLKKNVLVENVMSYGHKALLRPRKMQYLNYFNIHWEKISNQPNTKKIDSFDKISMYNWKQMEKMLGEIEQKTLNDDFALNKTIEKIFTYAEHETIPSDWIEDCDDDFDEFKMEKIIQIDS